MVNYSPRLDAVFSALADPTRRRMVERLARGELTIGALASEFPISQPAISKHIKVLEASGLIAREIRGREHHCRLEPATMRAAASWLDTQQRYWNAALDRLDEYLSRTSPRKKKR